MPFDAHANLAGSLVVVAPSPDTSGTTLEVVAGEGALFPAVPFNCTVMPANTMPTQANAEIVRVTNITGDVFTITRAQEGTTAKPIAIGYFIANSITVKDITDIEDAVNTIEGGYVTSVAGTTGQVLVNGGVGPEVGAVTLSLDSALTGINSVTSATGQALTLATLDSNANVVIAPHGTGYVVVNKNSALGPSPVFEGFQIVGKDSTQTAVQIETFAQQSRFITRRANGTAASPSALAANDSIAVFQGTGYGTSAYSTARAGIGISADEAWSNTVNGMRLGCTVVLNGSTTGYESLRLDGTGRTLIGMGGTKSVAAWGTFGTVASFNANSAGTGLTYTDSSSSGPVATATAISLAVPTFAASSATTFTDAANLYIAGDVGAGTNVTLTNSYGLWNVGKTRLDGALQLSSTNTAGLQIYNTTDRVTNYERLEEVWSGNVAIIRNVSGGSGSARSLKIGSLASGVNPAITFNVFDTAANIRFNGGRLDVAQVFALFAPGTQTVTSGSSVGVSIMPSYNPASGNPNFTDLLINRTEGATMGGGAQLLIDAQMGGTSQFKVTNAGVLTVTGSLNTGTPSGGTSGAWKLGVRVAATVALDTTQYIELDVGGTLYKLGVVA